MNITQYLNKIVCGDCLDLFKDIPDESVDMTFADPPFNLDMEYASYKDTLESSSYLDWCERWISEMVRVTKPTGSIFLHNIPQWLAYYPMFLNRIAHFKYWITWNAPTGFMGKVLKPSHYGILFYTKSQANTKIYKLRSPHERDRKQGYLLKEYGGKIRRVHPFGPLVSDVWTDIHRIIHASRRDKHPCQLPVCLLDRLILLATDEGDIVLDPFSGTGTTAIAAKRLGRNYIGFELDRAYLEISECKLKHVEANSRINNHWVSFYRNEIITLRDQDWCNLKKYFVLPDRPQLIDRYKIELKVVSIPPEIKTAHALYRVPERRLFYG
jgi:site-specific DNA-methyltransferase (adenine-specific)